MASLFEQEIQTLTGVGEKRAKLFHKLGVFSVGALLRFYPRTYEDWVNRLPLNKRLSESPVPYAPLFCINL